MCAIATLVTIGIAAVAASCFPAPGALSSASERGEDGTQGNGGNACLHG